MRAWARARRRPVDLPTWSSSGTTSGLLRLLRGSKNTQNTQGGRAGNQALRLPVRLGGLLVCLCTQAPWLRCRRPGALPFGLLMFLLWWFVVCGLLVLVFNPPALR